MAESPSALQRRPTTASLLSWWSDRNPPGATISLHALTKPLLKYMYHRQALDLIKKDEDLPISPEKLETLTTYLTFKYIWTATKVVVLDHINQKASTSEGEAKILLDGGILSRISELLQSPDHIILRSTTRLLRTIVRYGALINTVVKSDLCPDLVLLSCSEDVGIQERVICILAQISSGQHNAVSAIAGANFLSHITRFLESHNHIILGATCWIVGKIARQEAQYGDLVALHIFRRLVALLELPRPSDPNPIPSSSASLLWGKVNLGVLFIQRNATHALADVSCASVDGAREVINANALDHARELLESVDRRVLASTCLLLGNLACHKSLRLLMAIDGADFREPLASLLQFLDTRMARWMAGDARLDDRGYGSRELEHCITLVASLQHEDEMVRAGARDTLNRLRIGSEAGAIMVESATALILHIHEYPGFVQSNRSNQDVRNYAFAASYIQVCSAPLLAILVSDPFENLYYIRDTSERDTSKSLATLRFLTHRFLTRWVNQLRVQEVTPVSYFAGAGAPATSAVMSGL
ncbi:armadillo-type protein [Mycena galericulata]|nr:armadillo-type protein [Mycena galericulata]